MATMKDVAKKAGVAPITVSRVLNNPGSVASATKKKVMKAIEELNFKPNQIARSMITRRTNTIGMLLSNITNPYFPEVLLGLEVTARSQGKNLIICNAIDYENTLRSLDVLLEKRVDGIIVAPIEFPSVESQKEFYSYLESLSSKLSDQSIPVVFINNDLQETSLSCVSIDNYLSARLAMEHLLALGHKRIAHLTVERDVKVWIERLRGYKDMLASSGIAIDSSLIAMGSEDVESAERAALELLKRKERPTAVFAANDTLAIGVIHAANRLGLNVPRDLSVIGIDGTPLGLYIYPKLTSVSHPRFQIGEVSVKLIIDKINGDTSNFNVTLKPELLARDSTGPVGE
ncbi:LacI family DNA-binding transcriptional regulator [Cohnella faecalis]|uniref:LacI family transcriptional regulator n=1 Tax=Cohnella faecalis TaxID=2315694 RepID=A0A398CXZ2_9BACL|nr:LacI family DNA-binding transcriptional regulator [Cohnella faecalis]RIE03864.1 LacI family transcriptional regulator [Cohnella faecalis]